VARDGDAPGNASPDFSSTDWRRGADVAAIEAKLRTTSRTASRPSAVVHNETSTGCPAHRRGAAWRWTPRRTRRLLLVDTISSLASIDYRHDEWGVVVTVAGSQKG
jgi:alanine-glyoxylate transaminase/serine-glyoxylate transaminase/serine-pyruvate transaminase